jgi:DNA polymerase-3 subunit epsilon
VCASIFKFSFTFLNNIVPNFSNENIFDLRHEKKYNQSKKNKYTPDIESKKIDKSYVNTNFDANVSNPFYLKNVLFTGELENFDRQEAAMLVAERGGIVKQSVSKQVEIIVQGVNAGWAKHQKIQDLQDTGHYIEIIDEDTFIRWLAK